MRPVLLLSLLLFALNTRGQSRNLRLTVVFFNNQNINSKVTVDTLLKSKQVDLSRTAIDIFFTYKEFHLPYYVPTEGIFKNAAKDKECDMRTYPRVVQCYEYDKMNRVVKMYVNGSGTINNFFYKYNNKNQITEINDIGTRFTLLYNANGTLSELREVQLLSKITNRKLIFIYK